MFTGVGKRDPAFLSSAKPHLPFPHFADRSVHGGDGSLNPVLKCPVLPVVYEEVS